MITSNAESAVHSPYPALECDGIYADTFTCRGLWSSALRWCRVPRRRLAMRPIPHVAVGGPPQMLDRPSVLAGLLEVVRHLRSDRPHDRQRSARAIRRDTGATAGGMPPTHVRPGCSDTGCG